jgi:hypothetical protein
MFKNLLKLILAASVFAAITAWHGTALTATDENGAKLTHPVHGHKARSFIKYIYGPDHGHPSSWSQGDITFPESYPPVSALTEEEKYIIAGSDSSAWSRTAGLCDWVNSTQSMVAKFYDQYGYVPDQLTPAIVRSIQGMEQFGDENLRQYLNPLTDEWPKLKAAAPSPGDIYIRPLTADEISHYAGKSKNCRDIWIDGRWKDPSTGEYVPVKLDGKVYYMRVYGWNAVIYANFVFGFTK